VACLSLSLIPRRPFNVIDNKDLDRPSGRLQPQTELFLHGAEQIGTGGIPLSRTRIPRISKLQREIVRTLQASLIPNRSPQNIRQLADQPQQRSIPRSAVRGDVRPLFQFMQLSQRPRAARRSIR
jgi:hypothetical protein